MQFLARPYLHPTDEHGNVSAISDTSRNVVADYDFDAFGNETVSTDTYYNPMRYCGEYYDAETGLIYLRARYYDPSIGRFISEDPHWNLGNMIYGDRAHEEDAIKQPDIQAISQANNLYVYCLNNPILLVDPTGLRTYFINGINNTKKSGAPQYSVDFAKKLTDKGVEDVRTVGVYNGTGTISGVKEVIMEMSNNGKYANSVANMILKDLENDPLADGEELNLIGYSGGGQIVLNVCELLQGKATVDNSILIGAPLSELTLNNTGKTTIIYAGFDPLSWNIAWGSISFEFAGWFGHTDYFNKDNINKVANIVNKYID